MLTEPMNFEVAKQARLRPSDIAKLLRISRITVSLWFNGHTQPHHFHSARVQRLLDAIQSAMDAGDLPVPLGVSRKDRALVIERAVKKHLAPERDDLTV